MTTTPAPAPDLPDLPTRTTVLITGATRGLGLETARRLAGLGWTVWLGARSTGDGQDAVAQIRAGHPAADVRAVRIDVTDDASVAAAVETIADAGTGLDVLINNAGIAKQVETVDTDPADLAAVYEVNVYGPVRVTKAFLGLLGESEQARLVMVSSGLGSIEACNDPERPEYGVPGFAYQSSKAALNMIANQYAKALPEVRVAAVDPGYTATDLNGNSGFQTVTEGTDAVVAAASADEIPASPFDRDDLPADQRTGS